MSSSFRHFLIFALCATASAAGAAERRSSALVPAWSRATAEVAGHEEAAATFTLQNTGSQPLYVLDRELPFTGLHGDLFDVRRDGEPVEYIGRLYRALPPRAIDFRQIAPGERLAVTLDLEGAYDFSRPGRYTVQFRGFATAYRKDAEGGFVAVERVRQGTSLLLDVQRPEPELKAEKAPVFESETAATSLPIILGCSASRMQLIQQVLPLADQMATKALFALSFFSTPPNDYVKWFGPWTFDRQWGLFLDFANIEDSLDSKTLYFYCDCTEPGYFAWTQKGTQGVIHLCPGFWFAPLNGFGSKADTLVHEVSHWPTWGGDTDDYVDGFTASLQLAATMYPWALDNADNFAFFAADQP